jgi:hypothetical protein
MQVVGWMPDGQSLLVYSRIGGSGNRKLFRVNIATGKMEFWKEFGTKLPAGGAGVGPPRFSSDTSAYAYPYDQALCEA